MFPLNTDIDSKVTLENESLPISDDLPFNILLMGDWSGKAEQLDESDLNAKLQTVEIDRDNFDDVLDSLNTSVSLIFSNDNKNVLTLRFNSLDDFHPDNIFQNLSIFADLRDIRRQLLNSDTFYTAAREVKSWLKSPENTENSDEEISENLPEVSDDLLGQILNQSDAKSEALQNRNTQSSELSNLIKNIVKPHIVQIDTEEQSELLMVVDEVISDLMRKIIHHPHFQSLESAWRGLYFMVRRIETSSALKIYILDISKKGLTAKLKSSSSLAESDIFKILNQKDDPLTLIGGNYSFSINVEDISTLIRMTEIAKNTNTSFVTHIKPGIFGLDSFEFFDSSENLKVTSDSIVEQLWTMLRVMPESAHLGLGLCRVLARLPYGKATEPTETFYFEEFISDKIPHEQYLWFNPIFVIALLLAKTFQSSGWEISQNLIRNIDGIPLHFYQGEWETTAKPCGEIEITENNHEIILEQGLLPLIFYKNEDRLRLGRLQSVAHPSSLLKGRWS